MLIVKFNINIVECKVFSCIFLSFNSNGFNLNIVECKERRIKRVPKVHKCFNLNIVECKGKHGLVKFFAHRVLI